MNELTTANRIRRRALILLDKQMEPRLAGRIESGIDRQPPDQRDVLLTVDCQKWDSEIPRIRESLNQHGIDYVLFSRNDQILERINIGPVIRDLQVGYSTFSAIDDEQLWDQTEVCLEDYLGDPQPLELTQRESGQLTKSGAPFSPAMSSENTFSLIFDLEQLAGARYGLPRVLDLLDEFQARATFFTTSVVEEVYPGTVRFLKQAGHEVGIHGQYHEYLAGKSLTRQTEMISEMKSDFESAGPVEAGNFIYRMDDRTVTAMASNGLKYFVTFMEHRYAPFSFSQPTCSPLTVDTPEGPIQLVPVSVETYNRPWFAVKNMIDSAISVGRHRSFRHFNILGHPFRDGNLRHVGNLRRILSYLTVKRGMACIPVGESVPDRSDGEPTCHVYYTLGEPPTDSFSPSSSFLRRWWHHRRRYEHRIGLLMQALTDMGERPALCACPVLEKRCFSVYPYLPPNVGPPSCIAVDPLMQEKSLARILANHIEYHSLSGESGPVGNSIGFVPRTGLTDLANAFLRALPRSLQDCTAMIPELALRIAYRVTPSRKVF